MESQPQNPEFRKNPENFHSMLKRTHSATSLIETVLLSAHNFG